MSKLRLMIRIGGMSILVVGAVLLVQRTSSHATQAYGNWSTVRGLEAAVDRDAKTSSILIDSSLYRSRQVATEFPLVAIAVADSCEACEPAVNRWVQMARENPSPRIRIALLNVGATLWDGGMLGRLAREAKDIIDVWEVIDADAFMFKTGIRFIPTAIVFRAQEEPIAALMGVPQAFLEPSSIFRRQGEPRLFVGDATDSLIPVPATGK